MFVNGCTRLSVLLTQVCARFSLEISATWKRSERSLMMRVQSWQDTLKYLSWRLPLRTLSTLSNPSSPCQKKSKRTFRSKHREHQVTTRSQEVSNSVREIPFKSQQRHWKVGPPRLLGTLITIKRSQADHAVSDKPNAYIS